MDHNDKASKVDITIDGEALKKEALDALSCLHEEDRADVFDYFNSLIHFHKHASINRRDK